MNLRLSTATCRGLRGSTKRIFNYFGKLARDPKSGKITEKIQIYTHSRGAAFGTGYVEALLELINKNSEQFADSKNVIDFVYNMAPHQSDGDDSPTGADAYSSDHNLDPLSGNDIGGLKAAFSSNENGNGTPVLGPHSTASFNKDVGVFLQSYQSSKGSSSNLINNFVGMMKDKYGINVTVTQ